MSIWNWIQSWNLAQTLAVAFFSLGSLGLLIWIASWRRSYPSDSYD